MIPAADSLPRHDRGRGLTLIAIALTAAVAIYVMTRWYVATPLIPVLASLLPLLARSRQSALALRTVACVVMLGFAWLGLASVGLFFLPGALFMGLAVGRT
jgi:hypothetical protein